MAKVELRDISKSYDGDIQVVRDLNMKISPGEFVVLVGPSGCGKSTTLRMVAGLEDITKGDLFIDGKRVNDIQPKDRDIAMVFQNYALYPHMTVYGNMAFGLKLRKLPKNEIEKRVSEAARVVGMEAYLERKPKALSGGQRQRVALGRAIVRDPSVFLFDEPLSNLDAKLRVQMRIEISELQRKLEVATLYVTHDQTEAMTMADRIAVLDKGELMQFDTPMTLYRRPANLFVADFIGSPSMNFLKGKIDNEGFFHTEGNVWAPLNITAPARAKGREITLGVRPEHLNIGAANISNAIDFEFNVLVTEPLGNESFIYLEKGGCKAVIRVPSGIDPEPGSQLVVHAMHDKLYFFDGETGLAIYE